MNTSRILIPALWLASLVAAFVIGGKINSSTNDKTSSSDSHNGSRSAHRQAGTSSSSPSTRRKNTGGRLGSLSTSSSRDLDITDIAKNDDPIARANDLLRLINRLGADDFAQVVADFRELGITRERMSEYGMLLHAWAKVDPLGALDFAEENTGSPYARQTILASWAGSDPEGALMWAKNHHEGEGANPWLVGIIRGVVSKDPTRATGIMLDLPYSRERSEALSAIVPHIARQGYDKASLWLDTITDEKLKSGSSAYLASALAKQDPAKTAEWVTTLDESEGKSRATREVAEEWSEQDLPGAVAWTNTLAGADKVNAAREIIGEYAREDAVQAAIWLQSVSNEPGYEKVVESYIWNTARGNPEMSLAKVPEIQNPQSQEKYYQRILSRWRVRDAQAADAWMSNNNVTEKLRTKVERDSAKGRDRDR